MGICRNLFKNSEIQKKKKRRKLKIETSFNIFKIKMSLQNCVQRKKNRAKQKRRLNISFEKNKSEGIQRKI